MDLDETIGNLSEELELSGISKRQNESAVPKPQVAALSEAEVEKFYSKLSKCNSKPVVLSLVPPYAQSYVLPSLNISTVMDIFKKQNLEISYNELLNCARKPALRLQKKKLIRCKKTPFHSRAELIFSTTEQGGLVPRRVKLQHTLIHQCPHSP